MSWGRYACRSGAIAVVACVAALGQAANASAESCGKVRVNGAKAQVTVKRVSCDRGKGVAREYYKRIAAGDEPDGQDNRGIYYRVERFRCFTGLGGSEAYCENGRHHVYASTQPGAILPGAGRSIQRSDRVLLGSSEFAPTGKGFGTVEPSTIYNGGVPSGLVKHIRWKHWGAGRTTGEGHFFIYKPGGGYYKHSVRGLLRAHTIRTCPGSTTPADIHLSFRVPKRPGGPLRRWLSWSGSQTICTLSY